MPNLLEKLLSDLLLFERSRNYDCALQSFNLDDVEGVRDQGIPDIVEISSYYLLVNSFREILDILSHGSSDKGATFLQG